MKTNKGLEWRKRLTAFFAMAIVIFPTLLVGKVYAASMNLSFDCPAGATLLTGDYLGGLVIKCSSGDAQSVGATKNTMDLSLNCTQDTDTATVNGPTGSPVGYFATCPDGKPPTNGANSATTTTKVVTPKNDCAPGTNKTDNGDACKVTGNCDAKPGEELNKDNCSIIGWLVIGINTLSALVALTVVIVIIVAGIRYSAAGDDPQKVAQAKARIMNAIIALVVFIFMYAFLQWVVPGGVL